MSETETHGSSKGATGSEEARLRALLDNAPYGAHMYELDEDDRLVFVGYNRRAQEILGIDHSGLIGKTLEEAFPGNAGTETPDAYRRVAREGGTWEADDYAYDSQGVSGVFEIYAFSFAQDQLSVFFRDVTEKSRLEKELRDSERFIASILDTSPDLVYIYDIARNRNVYANREVSDFLGYTPQQVRAFGPTLFQNILHPDDAALVSRHHARFARARDGDVLDVEYRMRHSSGHWRWLRSLDVPFARDERGRVTQILGFTEDTTDRRRAEQALRESEAELAKLNKSLEERVEVRTRELSETVEDLIEANEAKTRFLRSMSHELRTPLNSVIGFSSMLADGIPGEVNEEQLRQLAMIKNSGQHLLSLINDILDLSRIEAGMVEVHTEPIRVRELLEEIVASVGPAAGAKALALELDVPDPAPELSSDRLKVRQILLNLLDNAIKFTDSGSVVLRAFQASSHVVSFSVTDTGCGIPAEERGRIFGEFERAAGQAPTTEGTGLGLAISRGLAGSLGGTIDLVTEVGEGSTFTLTLPEEPRGSEE